MAEPYDFERGVVLVEIESSYGTDPTLVAADAIDVPAGTQCITPMTEMQQRDVLRPSPIPPPPVAGIQVCKVVLEHELKNGGTAGTATNLSDVIEAAGLKATVTGGVDVTHTPDLTAADSITVGEYRAGQLYEANGVRFDKMTISGKVGEIGKIKFEGEGLYVAPTDSSIISSPVLNTTEPPIVGKGGSFALNGYSFKLREFEINVEGRLVRRPNFGATTGIDGVKLGGYKCTAKCKVELPLVADSPLVANWLASDNAAWDQTIGTTAGNKIDIDMPRLRLIDVKLGNDGGIAIADLEYQASDSTDNASNDWISIKLY